MRKRRKKPSGRHTSGFANIPFQPLWTVLKGDAYSVDWSKYKEQLFRLSTPFSGESRAVPRIQPAKALKIPGIPLSADG